MSSDFNSEKYKRFVREIIRIIEDCWEYDRVDMEKGIITSSWAPGCLQHIHRRCNEVYEELK